jgi:hypothetical protein
MSVSLNVHGVARVELSAYSAPLDTLPGTPRMHCQTLSLLDAGNDRIGQIVLFLDNPDTALPLGDRSQLDGIAPVADGLSVLAALSPF